MTMYNLRFVANENFKPGDETEVTIKPGMNGGSKVGRQIITEARRKGVTIRRADDNVTVAGPQAAVDAMTPLIAQHQPEIEEALDADSGVGDYLVLITKPVKKGEVAVELGVRMHQVAPYPEPRAVH